MNITLLTKQLIRAKKRLAELEEKYSNKEVYNTFGAGFDIGYLKGKIHEMEKILDVTDKEINHYITNIPNTHQKIRVVKYSGSGLDLSGVVYDTNGVIIYGYVENGAWDLYYDKGIVYACSDNHIVNQFESDLTPDSHIDKKDLLMVDSTKFSVILRNSEGVDVPIFGGDDTSLTFNHHDLSNLDYSLRSNKAKGNVEDDLPF